MASSAKWSASSGSPLSLPGLRTGAELLESLQAREASPPLPTRVPGLDGLQGGGLRRGTLIELVGGRSSGRFAVALASLASATAGGELAALIDLGDALDPRAAQEAGVELSRLLWARPRRLKDAVLAAETALGAGFSLVVLDCGVKPQPWKSLPAACWTRLARLCELHDAVCLLVAPRELAGSAAGSIVTVLRAKAQWLGPAKSRPLLAGLSVRVVAKTRRAGPPRETALSLPVEEEAAR